jgi:thioredoxin 1
MSKVVHVNGLNFEEEVLGAGTPVLVDVSAEWCPPCKAAWPVIETVAHEYAGRIKVVAIDGGESPELVARLGVRGFPTFIAFAAGQPSERVAGFAGAAALRRFAAKLLEA